MAESFSLLDATNVFNSNFSSIPIIDLQHLDLLDESIQVDPQTKLSIARQIRDACISVGFFYVKNHNVSDEVVDKTMDQARRFFDCPLEEKMKIDIHKSKNFKGYTPLLGENTDPENNAIGDLHEGFDFGWEEDKNYEKYDKPMEGENVWPELEGFKKPVLEYYYSVIRLGQTLFKLFALALDLSEDFFDDKTTKPAAIMRLLHYPPQDPKGGDKGYGGEVMGIGAHTDYECFTILRQDTIPALQVQNARGEWIDATPIPGTFVINIGDQLARWTNDVFKSTRHRASNLTGARRYSIPLFFGTDYDVKLEPIPSCVSAEHPSKYEVVTAGEYVMSRLEATYTQGSGGNSEPKP